MMGDYPSANSPLHSLQSIVLDEENRINTEGEGEEEEC